MGNESSKKILLADQSWSAQQLNTVSLNSMVDLHSGKVKGHIYSTMHGLIPRGRVLGHIFQMLKAFYFSVVMGCLSTPSSLWPGPSICATITPILHQTRCPLQIWKNTRSSYARLSISCMAKMVLYLIIVSHKYVTDYTAVYYHVFQFYMLFCWCIYKVLLNLVFFMVYCCILKSI